MENKSLSNKKIWITGASKGIGASIARKLTKTGATLILSSSSTESLRKIMPEFAEYPKVFFMPFDLKSEEEAKRMYEKIHITLERVDILINNAGSGKFAPFTELTSEDMNDMIDTNFKGLFYMTKLILPGMIKEKSGTIINILSVVLKKVFSGSSLYAASKAAVLAMDRSLREEVRQYGIKIVDIFPGATETDIWKPAQREKHGHRMMQPDDVAEAIVNIIDLAMNDRLMVEEIVLRPQGGDL
ncbi:SDR family oxidoreductase [Bacteroidota bacterium]